jgi:hypothetical protein
LPSSFLCSHCSTPLVSFHDKVSYSAMPSEYWSELVEAWVCHQDQQLNENILAHKDGYLPQSDEVLVASSYLLVPALHVQSCRSANESSVSLLKHFLLPTDRKETRLLTSIETLSIIERVIHRSNIDFTAFLLILAIRVYHRKDYMIGHIPLSSVRERADFASLTGH